MGPIDRRRFLRNSALGALGAAASTTGAARVAGADPGNGGACPPGDLDLSVPPSTLPADPADCPIEHIGVLMMENRTYDTYFGWLESGRGFLNLDLDLSYTDPATGVAAQPSHWAPEYRRCGHPDPDHSWAGGRQQLERGFLAGRNTEYALAYYLPEDIPIYARLARQFTVFDDYYCSVLGPTYPNRMYQHSGESGGIKSNLLPPQAGGEHTFGFTWPTIWDRLEAAGISWGYYFVDLPAIGLWGPRLWHRAHHIERYFLDAAAGTLPKVFFVDPGFLTDLRTDDHPSGADMRAAQAFVNNAVHAFVTSRHWERGALFINYDEWGGFFDHRVPPRVPDDRADPGNIDEDFGQLGFRVPALGLSPYSRKGYVHHDGPYDHTSILRFVEYRYELEPLTLRTATARNIGEAFDYTQEPRRRIGIDQMETPTVFFSSGCDTRPEAPNDFELLGEWLESQGFRIPSAPFESVFGFRRDGVPLTRPLGALR